jgi:alpha-tubulin suppressor-like RCC1 family protein
LALTYTGGVYSLGHDGWALGHGRFSDSDPTVDEPPIWLPRRIEALRGVRVRCVAAGFVLSCAVTDDGHVYTWGRGGSGALGHMKFEDELLPKRVEMLHDEGVFAVGVAAGVDHTLVADADGAVWGFGSLNAIGAWNDPIVKAMLEAENGNTDKKHFFLDESEDIANDTEGIEEDPESSRAEKRVYLNYSTSFSLMAVYRHFHFSASPRGRTGAQYTYVPIL